MALIDIGINLMNPAFDRDREAVIERAAAEGVAPLVITGSSVESSAAALDFAAGYNRENAAGPGRRGKVYAAAGVHPHNARHWKTETAETLRGLFARDWAVAAGECGLDYNRNFSSPPDQRRCFEAQLRLAAECHLPLFLHERDAFEDFSSMLGSFRRGEGRAVVHCFTGTERELDRYLELGCYIGITGWICDERRGAHLLPLLKKIPPDRLLLETDAPYLMPRNLPLASIPPPPASIPLPPASIPSPPASIPSPCSRTAGRSGRNESAYLVHIAEFAARILDKDPAVLAGETFANTLRFFNI
ncbi:MAG: TatD family hydrolase [Treponema sp.]|jgi:TatD DNase family protein|nr:TatD family hydrolase [Treponema sp.]